MKRSCRSGPGTGLERSRIVAEECHRVDPAIEILPWEYNIDFRPEKANLKRYFIQQLPARHHTAADLGKREEFRDRRPARLPA